MSCSIMDFGAAKSATVRDCVILGFDVGDGGIRPSACDHIEVRGLTLASPRVGQLVLDLREPRPGRWQLIRRWRWWNRQRIAIRELRRPEPMAGAAITIKEQP